MSRGDCCDDYQEECHRKPEPTCKNRCGHDYDNSQPCQCNSRCYQNHDCCSDYDALCKINLEDLSEKLFSLETNNFGHKIRLNLQCKTNVGNTHDCSPEKLFESVDQSVYSIPVYKKLSALYDNYDKRTWVGEQVTDQERQEENEFMQIILDSEVMQATFQYLVEKGRFSGSYEAFGKKLWNIWFGMYPRSSHGLSSSGFEHVFLGEVKDNKVSGQHNWFRWYTQEKAGDMNYLGYWQMGYFGSSESGIIMFTYFWDKDNKPYGSMFVGTSPELEMALYTVCFLTMPDEKCYLKMGGQSLEIQTWTFDYKHNKMIGSAYPDV